MTAQRRSYETGHNPKCLVIVDDTAEWDRAVYYASRWAVRVGGGVVMLRIIEIEDQNQQWLPYLGLWVISFVMGGAVCINAMSFDAMRVRAALDTGARLWHLLLIKNLALLCIVAPIGFLLSALLAWRAGDLGALFKACALVICFILLWLGVGNVLSIWLPSTASHSARKTR